MFCAFLNSPFPLQGWESLGLRHHHGGRGCGGERKEGNSLIFSVFMWHNHIWKLNFTLPSQVLVSSDKRPYRNLMFHNVSAWRGSSYCNRVSVNFQAFALHDMKIATPEGCRVGQKMSYHLTCSFCQLNSACTKRKHFCQCVGALEQYFFVSIAKLSDRRFSYFMAAMFVSLRRTQTWRLHTKLYKSGWHNSENNVRMKNRRDLILGEFVSISIIYHIPDSWLYSLNGYDF